VPNVNGEVHVELDTFALAVYGAPWRGKAGRTDRDMLLDLVGSARRYGVGIRMARSSGSTVRSGWRQGSLRRDFGGC
jgi:hypothetical protein